MNRTLAATCVIALACGWTLIAQRPGPEIAKGKGAITGRVLDAATKTPIAGAVVTLIQYIDTNGGPPSPGLLLGRSGGSTPHGVITNAEGYFVFGELPAGRFAIGASAFGYLDGGYLMPSVGAPVHLVDLDGAEYPTSIKVLLAKAASISGTIIDERGEPLPGVPVTAFRRAVGTGSSLVRIAPDVQTDDRGIYRIGQLTPGNYIVGVVSTTLALPAGLATQIDVAASNPNAAFAIESSLLPGGMMFLNGHLAGEGTHVDRWVLQRNGAIPPPGPDGRMLAYSTALFPGTANPADATTITINSGEERMNVDIPLRVSPAVRVSGVLTGPGGPMANVAVRAVVPNGVSLSDGNPGIATAITDVHGAFALLGVPSGGYTITAAYVEQPDRNAGPDAAGTSLWAAQPLAVGETDIADVALALRPGIRVGGRVEFRGTPPPSGPSPIVVILRPLGAGFWRTLPAHSGADGNFLTAGDPPGRYFLVAQASGTIVEIARAGKRLVDELIDLESSDVMDLVFTVSSRKSGVSGSVIGPAGGPDPESNVLAFPADTTLWREGILSDRRFCQAAVTWSAKFECSNLSPGEYFVVAIDANTRIDRSEPAFLARVLPGATRVTVVDSDDKKTVTLRTFTPRER